MHDLAANLEPALGMPRSVRVIWRPVNEIALDAETAEKTLKLIDALDELDDVQNIYANFDIADDILETLS